MRILGVDPGLERTGYGVIELAAGVGSPRLIEAGVIRTSPAQPLAARLMELQSGLADVLAELKPAAVAVEELYSHYAHPRTAILMNIKKALLGSGHASKEQMQRSIQSLFRLAKPPQPPDVADALAIALCHAYRSARKMGESVGFRAAGLRNRRV